MRHVFVKFNTGGKLYAYRVPNSIESKIKKGDIVSVPSEFSPSGVKLLKVEKVEFRYKEDKHINYVEILEVTQVKEQDK